MSRLQTDAAPDLRRVRAALSARPVPPEPDLAARIDEHFPILHGLFARLYGHREDSFEALAAVMELVVDSWQRRPAELRALDARRAGDPSWFESPKMLGGVCYVDRYAGTLRALHEHIPYFQELGLTYLHLMPLFDSPEGNDDGGYAVTSYRRVREGLGTIEDLAELAGALREAGISLVLDFIFNHTSDEHDWARRAVAGEPGYEDFYLIFEDRTLPDAYERTTREIFPDDHRGSFVQLSDGRWIWSTFYHFQWDLNYADPAVFRAMAGEMLFLAEQGVEVLRMDAVAFIWKRLGTSCESLPEAHLLLRAFNAVLRMAAPGVLFKSEAIVHPDEVAEYIDPLECQLSYNPLQMALTWEALATRDARLLSQALERRHALPAGTAWVNYVRSHDDIGWTFADEDAAELGIDGGPHRRFLNDFYTGRAPGSFARGAAFQENPRTGDARVAGTTAALAGVETADAGGEDRVILAHAIALSTGGLPLLYLGDEVGQFNDHDHRNRPAEAEDSRWVGRPLRPVEAYTARSDPRTVAGRLHGRLRRMIAVRQQTPEFGGNALIPFHVPHPAVLGYQRPGPKERADGIPRSRVLVLANVGDHPVHVPAVTLSGLEAAAHELLTDTAADLRAGLTLPAHAVVWLRVTPSPVAG